MNNNFLLQEMKDDSRKQINELTATIKQIEKHKLELINGFKKQMQLIDTLKKQKVHFRLLPLHRECFDNSYISLLGFIFNRVILYLYFFPQVYILENTFFSYCIFISKFVGTKYSQT